ncbi:hypothetical protein Q667_17955 [Marinobacter sp. C1S70]|uniref:ATP-binding cassette domain-containing protein n=1 Tax=Marinobacter sp. C1S70 TaxID=1396859 RepID=UPI0003B8C9E3|nr:ATP-binding cassette domain-containing protein [Marinobacter sp. C1S70]ERS84735.1 hypothetical protein Q667_17955 [Marinobacter sp. C1S70]
MIKSITCQGMSARYNAKQEYITNNINFSVSAGEMMAIMGPSGSGKSTLLNALLGKLTIEKGKGRIFINGEDVTDEGLSCVKNQVGFVPQKDILVDELTVRENIRYFHTIAVDSELSASEVDKRIDQLIERASLSPEIANKRPPELSGGQKKRASLLMELINDPTVLIIDEPTSGLSSSDSLEVMRYLKHLAVEQGKIVIVIIHQPSSAIFQLFNKLLLLKALGAGGRGECVASGTLKEIYEANQERLKFKDLVCTACDSLFPDALLDAVNAGNIRGPLNASRPSKSETFEKVPLLRSPLESLKDFRALTTRQVRIKARDKLSQLLTYAAPPFLGFLIAVVFKYSPPGQGYNFQDNALFGQFLFMMIISGFFLGMVSSVGEIIRDRDMLYRESLRGLSMTSYFCSKFLVLIGFGALQALLFTSVAFYTLDAMPYFLPNLGVMFSAIVLSIVIGLFISIWAKTAISAYNLIPLVLIPQIVLGGALLPFSNMGEEIYLWEDKGSQMPLLAKPMPAAWLYEGGMALNYQYANEHDLEKNIKVSEMDLRQRGDFLAKGKGQESPDWLDAVLPETVHGSETYIVNSVVLLGFGILFFGLAVIDVRKDYRNRTGARNAAKITLVLGLYGLALVSSESGDAQAQQRTAGEAILSHTSLTGNEAQNFCARENRSLAEASVVAELFNRTQDLAQTVYWTGSNYRGRRDVLWALDLSNANRPIPEDNVLMNNQIATAYPVTDFRAVAVCVEKPE